jgi:hypothetical protein
MDTHSPGALSRTHAERTFADGVRLQQEGDLAGALKEFRDALPYFIGSKPKLPGRISKLEKEISRLDLDAKSSAAKVPDVEGAGAGGGMELPGSDDDSDDDGTCEFGERVSLTARIRQILTGYPDGPTILKELVQNVGLPSFRVSCHFSLGCAAAAGAPAALLCTLLMEISVLTYAL